MNKEEQLRRQFLDEAQDYLNTFEQCLIGLHQQENKAHSIDQMLRSAHSIKGGAGMMGYPFLSQLGHRIEDFLKILKLGKVPLDAKLESIFLSVLDAFRSILYFYKQEIPYTEEQWKSNIDPILEQLSAILGELKEEDESLLLIGADIDIDVVKLVFESEIESSLSQIEELVKTASEEELTETLKDFCEELAGLGDMIELPVFRELCSAIVDTVNNYPQEIYGIAQQAIQDLRRTQSLVLVGQKQAISPHFNWNFTPTVDHIDLPPDNVFASFDVLPDLSFLDTLATDQSFDLPILEEILPPIEEKEEITVNPQKSAIETPVEKSVKEDTVRVSLSYLEQLGDLFGELNIEKNGLDLHLNRIRSLLNSLNKRVKELDRSNFQLRTLYDQKLLSQEKPLVTARGTSLYADFDTLELDQYSEFHSLSQEVMETIVQVQELTEDVEIHLEDAERTSRDLKRTSKRIDTTLTKIRLRPFSDLSDRLQLALREMSRSYGKTVHFQIKGKGVLIDRIILDSLNDPLLHLLRNAFDHGIESPEQREQAGKNPQGSIELTASYRGNLTVITLKDDGQGINLTKIRQKALSLGFFEEDLTNADDRDIMELIFEPGFSTAERLTDLSGRGVGMDIVKTVVQEIRGSIEVDTQPGQGTTFTITVPFTLSVIRVLLVESQGSLFAFPTNTIEEVVLYQEGKDIFREGSAIPIFHLSEHFTIPYASSSGFGNLFPKINQDVVLIVSQGSMIAGLRVDRYWGEQEVTIRQIEGLLSLPAGFSGCTILGDGQVVPLIDPNTLLNVLTHIRSKQDQRTPLKPHSTTVKEQKTILIVDDSINVRRFLALTLEKEGYTVEQAKDGQEAIEKISTGLPIQGIICDIEMPRLDGFGVLANLKSNANYRTIPIIMLTSRTGSKHRQIAQSLGAQGYLTKPFQEQELLGLLSSLL